METAMIGPMPFSVSGGGVYALVNRSNLKMYIGSSVKMSKRVSNHRLELKKGKHRNRHLQSAFNQDVWKYAS